jgi:hypothetical protein
MRTTCRAALLAALTLLPLALPAPSRAQVYEERHGEANPLVEIFKSTIYGALAGLVVGGAIELAAEGDTEGEALRWGIVGGTFLGLGYGIYHVASRPNPIGAMLEGGGGELALRVPAPAVGPARAAPVALSSVFPPEPSPPLEVRVALAAYRF